MASFKTTFHKCVYTVLRPAAMLAMRLAYNFHWEAPRKYGGPCFVIANHNLDLDAMLVACSFRKMLYFVAGENMFRMGLVSKIAELLVDPICRVKGSTDASAAIGILRRIKKGFNVCMFAEGNRSWNGVTAEAHPTTARLVKKSGASLVTYRIEGGYLTTPRWGKKLRRGRMDGRVVNVYSPERLKEMSVDEVDAAIKADIYENAFATQRRRMLQFKGRALAENLETAYYICPKCGRAGTLASENERFFCRACGMSTSFTEYGFFSGGDMPFETTAELDEWQSARLAELVASAESEPVFTDEGQRLTRLGDGHHMLPVSEGATALYRDRFVAAGTELPVSAISKIDMHGRENLVFTTAEGNFELRSNETWCARKYMSAVRLINSQREAHI